MLIGRPAFSTLPIGGVFLALMVILAVPAVVLIVRRRMQWQPDRPIESLISREALVVIGLIALLLLTVVTLLGTLAVPLSNLLLGRSIAVGFAFYNNVLIPTGLLLLAAMAIAPLLRWGKLPTAIQKRALLATVVLGAIAATGAFLYGIRSPVGLGVTAFTAAAVAGFAIAFGLDFRNRQSVGSKRRQYAGYAMHLGFACLAVGIAGSSLGTRRHEVDLHAGESIQWAGRTILCRQLDQQQLPGKLIAEAQLEISRHGEPPVTLRPAQHYHSLQDQWTTEVAIHSTWRADFYTIAQIGEEDGQVLLTLIENPLIRWIWLGGWVMGLGTVVRLWPTRRRKAPSSAVPEPKGLMRAKKRRAITKA